MRYNKVILLGLLLLITLVAFLPSLGNDFTNWDDQHLVSTNKAITGLSLRNFAKIFSSRFVGTYIPLTILSYAVEYRFFKLDPHAYHVTNLLLHLMNTLLVLLFFYRLTKNFIAAFVVSILFGIHPLHVESVAWITERKDVLHAFFYLSSLILFLQYRDRGRTPFYVGSLLLFILSLLSKPMAVTLPFVLFLLDYYRRLRFSKSLILEKVPFLALSVIFSIVNILTQESLKLPPVKYLQHVFIACHNYLFYLVKLVLPVNLSCLYPYPAVLANTIPLDFLVSPLILAGLAAVVYMTRKSTGTLVFGSLFFCLTLLPVVQLVPLIASAIAADRYTYLPSLGIFYMVSGAFVWFKIKFSSSRHASRFLPTIALALVIFVSALLTFQRCKVWKNSLTLWNDVLEKYPGSAVAYSNRGRYYDTADNHDKAIADYDRAIAIDSTEAIFFYNRGVTYSHTKNYAKALADLNKAVSIDPSYAIAYERRGTVYMYAADFNRALEDLDRALALAPDLAEAYYDRGYLFFKMNEKTMALENLDKALELDPRFAPAFLCLGDIYFYDNDYTKAISNYSSALLLDSTLVDAHYNRAVAYGRVGDLESSLKGYDCTLRLDPGMAQAYNNRANIYLDLGMFDDALSDYNRALSLDSLYAAAYYNRAQVYFLTSKFTLALQDMAKAEELGFEINPRFARALRDSLKKH